MSTSEIPATYLAPLPADTSRWMPTGTDAHTVGCMNNTPGTQPVVSQAVMFLGKRVGTLYLYENPSPTCGLVWAEFWTAEFAADFQTADIGHIEITLIQLGTSQTDDQSGEWDASDVSQVNDADEWTNADRITAGAQYQVALNLTGP